jgi:hypothetical protein
MKSKGAAQMAQMRERFRVPFPTRVGAEILFRSAQHRLESRNDEYEIHA